MTDNERYAIPWASRPARSVGITKTITEISEHTNLLALNATIEAARAWSTRASICFTLSLVVL